MYLCVCFIFSRGKKKGVRGELHAGMRARSGKVVKEKAPPAKIEFNWIPVQRRGECPVPWSRVYTNQFRLTQANQGNFFFVIFVRRRCMHPSTHGNMVDKNN